MVTNTNAFLKCDPNLKKTNFCGCPSDSVEHSILATPGEDGLSQDFAIYLGERRRFKIVLHILLFFPQR